MINIFFNRKGNKKMSRGKILREIFDWLKYIAIAVILALLINNFILINAEIPTGSMEKTIMTNDRLFAFRLSYILSEPKRGDIIVFKFPDNEDIPYVKRVIGLPGEEVEIVDGKVYVDSKLLDEPYLTTSPKGSYGPYSVPDDSYFMLGDNRNSSVDSRFWDNTFVNKEKILGKVFLRYWPKPGIISSKEN
jgi:signal peptidase I